MVENGNYSLSQNRNPILPAPSGREPATPSSLRKGDRLRWKEFKSRPLQGKVPDRAEGANSALCTLNRPRHPVTLISRPIQISILSQFLQKVSLSRHASCRLSTSPPCRAPLLSGEAFPRNQTVAPSFLSYLY